MFVAIIIMYLNYMKKASKKYKCFYSLLSSFLILKKVIEKCKLGIQVTKLSIN